MVRKDIAISAIIGTITGAVAAFLLTSLGLHLSHQLSIALPFMSGLLFVAGLQLGIFLSRWWPFFDPFARFVIIGFSNAAVDFGILNVLIFTTHITQGYYFSLFKTIGFIFALLNSYIWNKFWTFNAGKSGGGHREVGAFVLVVAGSLIINVGISSLIVNFIPPLFGVSLELWVNIASAFAVIFGLFWNFLGMRFLVFKKHATYTLNRVQGAQ